MSGGHARTSRRKAISNKCRQAQPAVAGTDRGAGRTFPDRGVRSAEPAGDVVLGTPLARVGEDLLGVVDLDQLAGLADPGQVEERGALADPGRLLHVVGDDNARVLLV